MKMTASNSGERTGGIVLIRERPLAVGTLTVFESVPSGLKWTTSFRRVGGVRLTKSGVWVQSRIRPSPDTPATGGAATTAVAASSTSMTEPRGGSVPSMVAFVQRGGNKKRVRSN